MFFEVPGHQRPIFNGFIYIHYALPPYSGRITIYTLPFGKVWLNSVCWLTSCAMPSWQQSRMHSLRRVGRNFGPILSCVCSAPKFMIFPDDVEHRSYFPTHLPDCLHHLSVRRHLPLSIDIVEKPNRCVKFLARFFFAKVLKLVTYVRGRSGFVTFPHKIWYQICQLKFKFYFACLWSRR